MYKKFIPVIIMVILLIIVTSGCIDITFETNIEKQTGMEIRFESETGKLTETNVTTAVRTSTNTVTPFMETAKPVGTLTPASVLPSSAILFENFDDPVYPRGYNPDIWFCDGCDNGNVVQDNGSVRFEIDTIGHIDVRTELSWPSNQIDYIQSKMKISGYEGTKNGDVHLVLGTPLSSGWWQAFCFMEKKDSTNRIGYQCAVVFVSDSGNENYEYFSNVAFVDYDSWHTAKIKLNPTTFELRFYFDNELIGRTIPSDAEKLKDAKLTIHFGIASNSAKRHIIASIDDVILVSSTPIATQKATQQSPPSRSGQTPQLIDTIKIPSDTNAGVTYTAPQTDTYIFQYSDSPSAIWNGVMWVTEVLAFRGYVPKWHDSMSLDADAALFKMGDHEYTTKQAAIEATKGNRGIISLKAGEVITLIVGDGKPYYADNTGEIILDVYVLSSSSNSSVIRTSTPTELQSSCERLIIPYTGGISAVTSKNSYQGLINVTSSGYGKAGGDWTTDSFYLFIDEFGNNISPRIPNQYNEYILHINNKPAFTFIPEQAIPEYRSDHVYSFTIEAPSGKLVFGVNDKFLTDNTGSYEVTLCTP